MLNKKFMAGMLLMAAFTFGCKKDSENTQDDFSSTAEDIGQAENVSSDVDNMVSQAKVASFSHSQSSDNSFDQFNFHSCATVTNDSVNHILTFDFGTGCTGPDGRTRSGIVSVSYSGNGYFDPGASWTVTFTNYYVNGRHVEGTRSVVNNGLNGSGNMTWSINAQNMKITRPDGSWRSWNSTRTRELISGYGDSTWTNDVYSVNGTMSGTNSSGESVNCVLTNVTRSMLCHFITSGTIQITPSNKPVRTIDFGNGTCDDIATVTKNGMTKTIHLRF
jgi:hypothetical protein